MKHEGVVIAVMSAVYAVVKVNKWFCLIYILFVLHRQFFSSLPSLARTVVSFVSLHHLFSIQLGQVIFKVWRLSRSVQTRIGKVSCKSIFVQSIFGICSSQKVRPENLIRPERDFKTDLFDSVASLSTVSGLNFRVLRSTLTMGVSIL